MKIMTSGISTAMFVLALGFPGTSRAAGVVVDWLDLASGSTASAFSLTSDTGLTTVQGGLAVQNGASFPGFPTLTQLNAGYWSGNTGFMDSVTGDDRVGTFDIRVASQGSAAAYTLTLDVPSGRELIVAVGGLFRGNSGATGSIVTTASGGGVVSFIQTLAWDGGNVFDQELEWDGPSGTLSTTAGSEGDSEVAFLRVSPLSGPNPQLLFMVPDGYGSGSGDSISIGIGTVIPEPGILALAGLGAALLLAGRRR